MSNFKDHFSIAAKGYQAFRPHYPQVLFEHLASLAPTRALAWDCATGSGQAAAALAEHFENVIATDASASQIANATAYDRVEYRVQPAERTQFAPSSIDLITVAQALHWFDIEQFIREVSRVLKPGGILAVWSYNVLSSTPAIDEVVDHLYRDVLDEYWPAERHIVANNYADISMPFEIVDAPAFDMRSEWALTQLMGYLSTWSATNRYHTATGVDPVAALADKLATAWGDTQSSTTIRWPLTLKIWRNAT